MAFAYPGVRHGRGHIAFAAVRSAVQLRVQRLLGQLLDNGKVWRASAGAEQADNALVDQTAEHLRQHRTKGLRPPYLTANVLGKALVTGSEDAV